MSTDQRWFDVRDCPKCGAECGISCRSIGCVQLGYIDEQPLCVTNAAPTSIIIYVVQESGGQYEDSWTCDRHAFYDKSQAEQYVSEQEKDVAVQSERKLQLRAFSKSWRADQTTTPHFKDQRAADLVFCRSMGITDNEAIHLVSEMLATPNTWDIEELQLS